MKILAVYLSPSQPLIGSELYVCPRGVLPILIAGDLTASRGLEFEVNHDKGHAPA